MRRLLTWALVTFGVAALVRRFLRRGGPPQTPTAQVEDDPADELRRKLAESRTEEPAEPPAASIEERRADVHEQGRSALDEMRGPDEA